MLWQGDFSILLGTEFRSLLLMYRTLYYPACSSSLGLALLFGYRSLDPRSRARTTPEPGFGEVLFSVKVLGKKILWPFLRPPKACQLLPPYLAFIHVFFVIFELTQTLHFLLTMYKKTNSLATG